MITNDLFTPYQHGFTVVLLNYSLQCGQNHLKMVVWLMLSNLT